MENTYIFIIWHKALFARNRIINDLKNSFTIINSFKIKWDDEYFENNLRALYGRKLGPAQHKIDSCGRGEFEFIIVKDEHPSFKKEIVFDEPIEVNTNIFEKKKLYRKWTAGRHRIHCSDNQRETEHDLTILFGPEYQNIIHQKIEVLHKNTIGVEGIKSFRELMNTLYYSGNEYHYPRNKKMLIVDRSRFDICSLLNLKYETDKNIYELKVSGDIYTLIILGILDGDITEKFLKSEDIKKMIIALKNIETQKEIDSLLNLNSSSRHNPCRQPNEKRDLLKDFKDSLKYLYCSLIYR